MMKEKMRNLEQMDKIVRGFVSDEDIQDIWFAFYPDNASEYDKQSIAEDEECYNEIVETFLSLIRDAFS